MIGALKYKYALEHANQTVSYLWAIHGTERNVNVVKVQGLQMITNNAVTELLERFLMSMVVRASNVTVVKQNEVKT